MSDQQYVYVVSETFMGEEYILLSIHQTKEGAIERAEKHARKNTLFGLQLEDGETLSDFIEEDEEDEDVVIQWTSEGVYVSVMREKLKK